MCKNLQSVQNGLGFCFDLRRPIGPGQEIIKWPMYVRPFITFYKRLHISFKLTKLTQKVYVNKGMSFITFGFTLKNKMAARTVFRPFSAFFITVFLRLYCSHIYYVRGCLTKGFSKRPYICSQLPPQWAEIFFCPSLANSIPDRFMKFSEMLH